MQSIPGISKALIVDDDPDFREQQRLMLAEADLSIRCAASVAEAMEVLADFQPDVALLDLMMEHEDDGFTLAYRIKQRYPETIVIIVTSVASETGLEFGAATSEERKWVKADAMLAKPVRMEQLLREISKLRKEEGHGHHTESTVRG
jgi:CheY-like chemotaxis protein